MPNTPTPTARLADDAPIGGADVGSHLPDTHPELAHLIDDPMPTVTVLHWMTPTPTPERTCAGCRFWRDMASYKRDWGKCIMPEGTYAPVTVISSMLTKNSFSCAEWQAKESAT